VSFLRLIHSVFHGFLCLHFVNVWQEKLATEQHAGRLSRESDPKHDQRILAAEGLLCQRERERERERKSERKFWVRPVSRLSLRNISEERASGRKVT